MEVMINNFKKKKGSINVGTWMMWEHGDHGDLLGSPSRGICYATARGQFTDSPPALSNFRVTSASHSSWPVGRPCLLHAGCSLSRSSSLGWLSLCQVCIVVSPSCPFSSSCLSRMLLSSLPPSECLLQDPP